MRKDPQPLTQILSQDKVGMVIAKAKQLLRIQQILNDVLRKMQLPACKVLNVEYNQLYISAENAAIATRLRYLEPDLAQALQSHHETRMIQFIHAKVKPKTTLPETHTPEIEPKTPISPNNKQLIKTTAEGVMDARLRAALEKLTQ